MYNQMVYDLIMLFFIIYEMRWHIFSCHLERSIGCQVVFLNEYDTLAGYALDFFKDFGDRISELYAHVAFLAQIV